MATTTGFFGLQKLQSGDPLSTNDYAFTNRNVDVIDRLLGKLDDAVFENDTPLDDPTELLSLEVIGTGGLIPAGRTLRYKYTYVDAFGNESAASPEAVVSTDAPISRPSAPGVQSSSTGGTLLAGNYFYILSAYSTINTNETSGSPAASLQIRTGSTNKITLTLPSLPAGADGFNIFRRGPGEVQFFYLDTVDMDVATPPSTYEDDNSVTVTNSRTPSATNLTNSTNLVNIILPGATPSVPDGYTWKLYRTFVSGDYNSSLLEWIVTEVDDAIVPYAVDSGLVTTIGIPPSTSSLTGATSRIATLESEVADLEAVLGTNPQAGFADVAERLDDIDSSITSIEVFTLPDVVEFFSIDSDLILDDDFGGPTVTVLGGSLPATSIFWSIEGQIFFESSVAEGLKFQFTSASDEATPRSFDNGFIQVSPEALVTPSDPGTIFEEGDAVVISGDTVARGFRIDGSLYNDSSPVVFFVNFVFAQETSIATPGTTLIKRGSWIRFTGKPLGD